MSGQLCWDRHKHNQLFPEMRTSNMATRQYIMSHESPLFTTYLSTSHLSQLRQASLSTPSTYGLTWLYHIIILAVPSVCPAVLSSVQTYSPVINPSVYCPTLLHTACGELLLVSACTSMVVMANTCPGELEISACCLRFKGTPAGLESAESTGLCRCFASHTLGLMWTLLELCSQQHYNYQLDSFR